MKTAIAYMRVSTPDQAGADHFGLTAQRQAINDFAAREGFAIIDWFSDEGVSGGTLDRPGLNALLNRAKNPPVEVVLIAKMDRIARDLMAQLWIEKELLRSGVELVSVAEPFRGQDPTSILFRQIIGAFAEFEKSRIKERMSGGRKAKAAQGGYAGGGAPYGYANQRGSRTLTVNREEAEIVRHIFTLRNLHPDWSLRQLAQALNAVGHRTRNGKAWQAMQVQRILERESFYRGLYQYGDITSTGQFEAILGESPA